MPEYNSIRRRLWPIAECIVPELFAYELAHDHSFAGVIEKPVQATRRWMERRDRVYPNAAAALKYRVVDGVKVDERGSYAYRPQGRFGKWQVHYRLFPHASGTAIFAHRELNPLVRPLDHYDGLHWSSKIGVRVARERLAPELVATYSPDGIGR